MTGLTAGAQVDTASMGPHELHAKRRHAALDDRIDQMLGIHGVSADAMAAPASPTLRRLPTPPPRPVGTPGSQARPPAPAPPGSGRRSPRSSTLLPTGREEEL